VQGVVDVVDINKEILDLQTSSKVSFPFVLPFTEAEDIHLTEIGSFIHPVESEMLCSLTVPTKIPYFNAPIFLSNKTQIGKVDEILGPINEVYFTVKMDSGMMANSFKKEDKVYIGGDKLLPIERFLPKPAVKGGEVKSK
jgi:H/ACA ribonucleoprotein complex subunit 1